jgi:CBS domain-containing protein
MSRPVETVTPATTIADAVDALVRHDGDEVVGMVSTFDLASRFARTS